jgi:DNA-binding response OmpR family regulator
MSGERLLLVDDEDNLRSMPEAALRHNGFDVTSADCGRAALAAAALAAAGLAGLEQDVNEAGGRRRPRAELRVVP